MAPALGRKARIAWGRDCGRPQLNLAVEASMLSQTCDGVTQPYTWLVCVCRWDMRDGDRMMVRDILWDSRSGSTSIHSHVFDLQSKLLELTYRTAAGM